MKESKAKQGRNKMSVAYFYIISSENKMALFHNYFYSVAWGVSLSTSIDACRSKHDALLGAAISL
eukprot:4660996-Pleurochrysis_carterae.AAC.2